MDWCGIPVGDVAWIDNFAVWICADEETTCDTPNVLVLEITIKDGDGDSTDDVNNGDDSGRCDDSDDWPDDDDDDDNDSDNDDDDAKYDVCIDDGDIEVGGGDITDDDKENDIDPVIDNDDDDETVGVGGA